MARYKLTLTTEDGELLEQWLLDTDPGSADGDYTVPLEKMAPGMLVREINQRVQPEGVPND